MAEWTRERKARVDLDEQKIMRQVRKHSESKRVELLEMIIEDTDPYVPYDTGALRESATTDGESLYYYVDYARAVYDRGYYVGGGTGHANWLEASMSDNLEKWEKEINKEVRAGKKG